LYFNNLEYLPESFGNLKNNLESLVLDTNKLNQLPESFRNCKKL